jgi:CubicO group peptidase (beta-lactamase class C family)
VACSLLGAGCVVDERVELEEAAEAIEATPAPGVPPLERSVKSIVDDEVGPMWEGFTGRRRYAGVSVVVIRNGSRYQFHYGEAVLGSGVKPNANTLYAIGSVTKTFTATLLALADRRGLVDLEDLLDQHTTSPLGGDRDQITLQDLALHHAGLPKNPPGGVNAYHTGTYSGDMAALMDSLDDCADGCDAPVPLAEHGQYSNYGYAVLGHVLAKKLGASSVQAAFNTNLLTPLGMTDTRAKYYLTDSSCVAASDPCTYADYGECTYLPACNMTFSPRAAIGYYESGGLMLRPSDEGSDDNIKAGSGTLWSTPADMTKWLAYQMDSGSGASAELRGILTTTHAIRTGDDLALLGVHYITAGGHPVLRKTGFINNQFETYLGFVEGGRTGVVVMSNLDGAFSPSDLGERLIDALAD